MAESRHEQIVAALVTSLEGIVGDSGATYWFTPGKVVRAPEFSSTTLRSDYSTIYVLSADDEQDDEIAYGHIGARMKVDLVVANRFDPTNEDPFNPSLPQRWTVQNRLVQDAKKRLRSDKTLGGLAQHIHVPLTERAADDTYLADWAVAFLRVLIDYSYEDATP